MTAYVTTDAHRRTHAKPSHSIKLFTQAELRARSAAEAYLSLARNYADCGDTLNAVSCCIEALNVTAGITRPLAVRDQIVDLIRVIDPHDHISLRIKRCMLACSHLTDTWNPSIDCKYLERFVSAHQLIRYPSDDTRFNVAYEKARLQLRRLSLPELYVVGHTSELCNGVTDQYFSVASSTMISRGGPYYLTDICAVVRE